MQLTVTGKQVQIGDALRRHIESSLDGILGKYFKTAIEGHVVIAKQAHRCRAEMALHVGRGIAVNASAEANEAPAAVNAAIERLGKQLRRYKRRLRDHHAKAVEAEERATAYVLAPVEDEDEEEGAAQAIGDGGAPAVIAEMSLELPHLTVGEAVMRMDLSEAPVLLFRNRSHGELNVVYRRADGHVGWIDPQLDPARRARRV
jgi:ribosomal subunit interface protein